MSITTILSMATAAGIIGLLVLNASNTAQIIDASAGGLGQYIKAVQGR